jgi:UDP-2,3-diacylglucosamine hydrolase
MINELRNCLVRHERDLEEVIFLGDLFDSWMEYPHRIQPEYLLFRPIIVFLRDRNIPVMYIAGNHDPWHLDFFRDVARVNLKLHAILRPVCGINTYLSHGDEFDVLTLRSRLARRVMRSRLAFHLYRWTFPARFGQQLPGWVSRKYGNPDPNSRTVSALREAASDLLLEDDIDRVIMGHSHQSCHLSIPEGNYVNAGSWFVDGSFVEVSRKGAQVRKYQLTNLPIPVLHPRP